MITALLLTTAPWTAWQGPAGPPQPQDTNAPGERLTRAAEAGWRPLDTIAAQVGDEVVTASGLSRYIHERVPNLTAQEVREASGVALDSLITLQLESQAGEDLGLNPLEIEHIVRQSLRDTRRTEGVIGLASDLDTRGLEALDAQDAQSKDLYRIIWRRSKIGYPPAGGLRASQDRFIRPSELRALYDQNKETILAGPDEVQFQELILSIAAFGNLEAAQAKIQELHTAARGGASVDDMVLEFGARGRETLGIQEWTLTSEIREDVVRDFAVRGKTGDVSQILTWYGEGQRPMAFSFLLLRDKKEGTPAPPFHDRDVQRQLRELYMNQWESTLLGYARKKLRDDAFLWLNPTVVPPESLPQGLGAAVRPSPAAPVEGPPAPPAEEGSTGDPAPGRRP